MFDRAYLLTNNEAACIEDVAANAEISKEVCCHRKSADISDVARDCDCTRAVCMVVFCANSDILGFVGQSEPLRLFFEG